MSLLLHRAHRTPSFDPDELCQLFQAHLELQDQAGSSRGRDGRGEPGGHWLGSLQVGGREPGGQWWQWQ